MIMDAADLGLQIQFRIDCVPPKSTAQAGQCILTKRDGTQFIGRQSGGKSERAKQDLLQLFKPHAPAEPLDGAVKLEIDWVYPWRKSELKRNVALGVMPCTTRPDVDNLAKFVLDICTLLRFWTDDGQVAMLVFKKAWGDRPGITVRMRGIPPIPLEV